MKKLWYISDFYRLDHEFFDQDMDNVILLTNCHIAEGIENGLNDHDSEYYRRLMKSKKIKNGEKAARKKQQQLNWLERRRRRISRLGQDLHQ